VNRKTKPVIEKVCIVYEANATIGGWIMSLRRFGYLILILFVAAVSGLAGAAGGGWLVYQASLESFAAAVEDAVPTSPAVTTVSNSENEAAQELFVSSTDVETAITETVQQVGPAVVTVFGTIPGQLTPFGRTSGGEVSGVEFLFPKMATFSPITM